MNTAHNKLLKADLGKLSSFLQNYAKKSPSHPSRLARRYLLGFYPYKTDTSI